MAWAISISTVISVNEISSHASQSISITLTEQPHRRCLLIKLHLI